MKKRFFLIFFGVVVVVLGFLLFRESNKTTHPEEHAKSIASLKIMGRVMTTFDNLRPLAIIKFDPTYRAPGLNIPLGFRPEDVEEFNPLSDFTFIQWKGFFSVQNEYIPIFPSWGYVEDRVKLSRRGRSEEEWDASNRLYPLTNEGPKPIYLLSGLNRHSTAVREAFFSAPMNDSDLAHFQGFFHRLLETKQLIKNDQEAKMLLMDKNPWVSTYGLYWLESRNRLKFWHFVAAMQNRSAEDVPRIFSEFTDIKNIPRADKMDFPVQFLNLPEFGALSGDHQLMFLKEVNQFFTKNKRLAHSYFPLDLLQKALPDFEKQLSSERRSLLKPAIEELLQRPPIPK